MQPRIRIATEADLPAINDIYNHYVAVSTCTYAETPDSLDDRLAWWREHDGPYRVIVLEADAAVVGWASLSRFRQRSGYRFTAEDSVYLRPDWCGKGWGLRLLNEIVALAQAGGFHSVIGGICASQEASIRLHARAGFREVARLHEVGFKFGRWLSVVYMQRML